MLRLDWVLLFIGIVMVFLGIFLFRVQLREQMKNEYNRVTRRVETTGEVRKTEIERREGISGNRDIYYVAKIDYSYQVSGEPFWSEIKFNRRNYIEEAKELLRSLPVGTKIKVFYNPRNPQDCITEYDEAFPLLGILGIALILGGVSAIFAAFHSR
jgi:hypothetical protein